MKTKLRASAIALALSVTAAGPCLAEIPSTPRAPDAAGPSFLPVPGGRPTGLGIERHVPPLPPADSAAGADAGADAAIDLVLLPGGPGPQPGLDLAGEPAAPVPATHSETCDPGDHGAAGCWIAEISCTELGGGLSTNPDGTVTCTWSD